MPESGIREDMVDSNMGGGRLGLPGMDRRMLSRQLVAPESRKGMD